MNTPTATPRTDEQVNGRPCPRRLTAAESLRDALVPSSFARQLETELACEKENRNHLIEKGAKLETELAAERARLDWLEANPEAVKASSVFKSTFGRKVWWRGAGGDYDTARAAIDAAMKEDSR